MIRRKAVKRAKQTLRNAVEVTRFFKIPRTGIKKGWRRRVEFKCPECNIITDKDLYVSERSLKLKNKTLYCSKNCAIKSQKRKRDNLREKNLKTIFPYKIGGAPRNWSKVDTLLRGYAAEHLVVTDLLLRGYRTSITQGFSACDIIVEVESLVYKIQVKSSSTYLSSLKKGGNNFLYKFTNLGGNKRVYNKWDFDILALVALEIGEIAYITKPFKKSYMLHPSNYISISNRKLNKKNNIEHYSFKRALKKLK